MKVVFDDVSSKTAILLNQTIEANLNVKELQVVPQGRENIKFIYFGDHPEEKPIRVELWVNMICQLVTKSGFPLNYSIGDDTITFSGVNRDTAKKAQQRRVRTNK